MKPLPIPEAGGSLDKLRPFVNVASEADFVLLVAWLLAALRPGRPYPVLVLTGEQGSAKSSLAALLRDLIDPNTAPLRTLPREDRDLFIAANNGHVIAIDNVSWLPPWLSDSLCRIATGGGFSTRTLYSDDEETLFDGKRPIILTGIEDFATRGDLADRAIFLHLEPIPEEKRRTEAELGTQFAAVQPSLIGVFCEALARGLAALPRTRLARLPRMADFALWATACEGALWGPGTFAAAYERNRAATKPLRRGRYGSGDRPRKNGQNQWRGRREQWGRKNSYPVRVGRERPCAHRGTAAPAAAGATHPARDACVRAGQAVGFHPPARTGRR